ncbi:hypothetical protein CS542_03175 [Pedobacter sp. IW39]|nr:hypothetical protein CS542_03175 [Pedobacter sp. IW39]
MYRLLYTTARFYTGFCLKRKYTCYLLIVNGCPGIREENEQEGFDELKRCLRRLLKLTIPVPPFRNSDRMLKQQFSRNSERRNSPGR